MSNGHRATGHRMPKEWAGMPGIELNFTADATQLGGSIAFATPATVLRMIGEYLVSPTDGGGFVNGDRADITVAIGVVSTDAFDAAATPDPASEPEYPWLYWADHPVFIPDSTPAERDDVVGSVRRTFDIRSMRKLKPRESLCWVVQYGDLTGTPPLTVGIGQTRVLLAGV